MSTIGREVIGRCDYDLLFADNKHPVDVCHITLAAGAKHKKGEILEILANGKCNILGTTALGETKEENAAEEADSEKTTSEVGKATSEAETAVAGYVLAEDADATEAEVIAVAYRSGHFIRNALIVKEGYSLTEKDETQLRNGGIYLSDAMI